MDTGRFHQRKKKLEAASRDIIVLPAGTARTKASIYFALLCDQICVFSGKNMRDKIYF